MQLVLCVGDKELDRITLNQEIVNDQDYINSMQRLLIVKNELALLAFQKDPIFYIEAPSGMGNKKIK